MNVLPFPIRGQATKTPRLETSPYENEGFFNDLPVFETELVKITPLPPVACSRGTIYRETALLDDGTRYPVVTGVPDHPRSDTALVFTTAWLTSSRGHNLRTLRRAMKAGYYGVMIGPEEELRNESLTTKERFAQTQGSSQPKVAHDMNRILDESLEHLDVRPDKIIALGESRGAMLAHGFNVPKYSGNRRLAYADLTAPCFARAPKLTELPGVAVQLVPEALTLGKLGLLLVTQPAGKHYSGTIHKDPEYYPKELLKIPKLMNGDAGKLATASMSARPETQVHVRIFEGDRWSQSDEWQKLYAPHIGTVAIELCGGYHLDIATSETLDNIELRLVTMAEMRGHDGSFDLVDFDIVKKAHLTRVGKNARNNNLKRVA